MDEMDRLADLKVALRPAEGPGEELRTRVLASLTDQSAAARQAHPRWTRPALVAAAAAVAVTAGALLLGGLANGRDGSHSSSSGTVNVHGGTGGRVNVHTAAFTLHVNADGSVTFTAHDVLNTTQATNALNEAGITGRVINDITPGCTTKADSIAPEDLYPPNTVSRGLGSSNTVTFSSSDYPPGGGLLVVVTSRGGPTGRPDVAPDPVAVVFYAFNHASKIPTCVDFADPGSS